MRSIARFAAMIVLVVIAIVTSAWPSAASEARPYDAPRVDPKGASIPPLPPEYHTQNEGWLRLAYHPSARERVGARALVAKADAIRAELGAELGVDVLSSVEVRIAPVPGEMARLAPTEPPAYATAVAFGELRLVVMSLASPLSLEPPDLADLLRHGLAHIALDQALEGRAVPRWFHEGYAVHVASDESSRRAQTLCMASLRGRLFGLADLEERFPADAPQSSLAYAQAADFVRFLTRPESKTSFPELIRQVRGGEPFERALTEAYGVPADIELAWRKDVAKRYGFLPVLLGSTIVWVGVAAAIAIRRARRNGARRPLSAQKVRRAEAEARSRALSQREPPAGSLSQRAPLSGSISQRASLSISQRAPMSGEIAAPPLRALAPRLRTARAEGDVLAEAVTPDPDVPKVEHEGEWHTLH